VHWVTTEGTITVCKHLILFWDIRKVIVWVRCERIQE
jgi:hypothetical protein